MKEIQNECRGLMGAIDTIQIGYNEMKEHLAANLNECANLRSIDVIDNVNSQLSKVRKIFESRYDKRVVKRKTRTSKREKGVETTDVETESYTSFSESNDESNSISERSEDDNTLDKNMSMGMRRYYLKKKALEIKSTGLHRLRSTVVETESSPKKKQHTTSNQTDAEEDEQQPSTSVARAQASSENDDSSGAIIIIRPKKVYHRHSKQYISSARKQVTECPR